MRWRDHVTRNREKKFRKVFFFGWRERLKRDYVEAIPTCEKNVKILPHIELFH